MSDETIEVNGTERGLDELRARRSHLMDEISDEEILGRDFKYCGVIAVITKVTRGTVKTIEHLDPLDSKVVIRETFSDIIEDGIFKRIDNHIEFLNEDETVGLSKVHPKHLDTLSREAEEANRRDLQIKYLIASARQAENEDLAMAMAAVFNAMRTEIDFYIKTGDNSGMLQKLDQFADPAEDLHHALYEVAILNAGIPKIYGHQSIRYQVGAITINEIVAANA